MIAFEQAHEEFCNIVDIGRKNIEGLIHQHFLVLVIQCIQGFSSFLFIVEKRIEKRVIGQIRDFSFWRVSVSGLQRSSISHPGFRAQASCMLAIEPIGFALPSKRGVPSLERFRIFVVFFLKVENGICGVGVKTRVSFLFGHEQEIVKRNDPRLQEPPPERSTAQTQLF